MEDLKDQENQPQEEVTDEDFELNHSDKLVGVFSEPASTFQGISKVGVKTSDWLIPLFVVIVISIISHVVMLNNPAIKYSMMEEQMSAVEERLDDMVESGQMTEAQKEQQIQQTRDFMENQGGTQIIFSAIGIIIFTFIMFFIVSGVFYAVSKFGLKGDGDYKGAMAAYGLPHYIIVVQVIVMVILAFVFDRFLQGTSVAAILDSDKTTFAGWVFSKLDIFSIWFYGVVAVGFAKIFKAESYGKYFAMVFGLWLGVGFIFWLLADALPFLRWFGV
ncbi:MAG: YIP1 family protein [Melioribacteraceae bacterium]|nr:YIP1 family protein [Melioribacteraceae bacterium]